MAGPAPGGRGVIARTTLPPEPPCHPNHPAMGTAPAELSASRGAALARWARAQLVR